MVAILRGELPSPDDQNWGSPFHINMLETAACLERLVPGFMAHAMDTQNGPRASAYDLSVYHSTNLEALGLQLREEWFEKTGERLVLTSFGNGTGYAITAVVFAVAAALIFVGFREWGLRLQAEGEALIELWLRSSDQQATLEGERSDALDKVLAKRIVRMNDAIADAPRELQMRVREAGLSASADQVTKGLCRRVSGNRL